MGKRFTRTNLKRIFASRMSTQHWFQQCILIYNTDVFSEFSFFLMYEQSARRRLPQLLIWNVPALNNNNKKIIICFYPLGSSDFFSRLYKQIVKSSKQLPLCLRTFSQGYLLPCHVSRTLTRQQENQSIFFRYSFIIHNSILRIFTVVTPALC